MGSTFEEMIKVAGQLGLLVRHVRLGGGGGGLAHVKGAPQLFIDLDAEPSDQLEQTARALGQLGQYETLYLRPDVRELIERYRH